VKNASFFCRFAFKHIIRAPLRMALLALVALFNVLALAFLLHTISTNEAEIDYLYLTTYVDGAIIRGDILGAHTNSTIPIVHRRAVERLNESGFLLDIYQESIAYHFAIVPSIPLNGFTDDEIDTLGRCYAYQALNFNNFDAFVYDNHPRLLEASVPGEPPFAGELIIEFAEGFSEQDLTRVGYAIPILVHEMLLSAEIYTGGYAYTLELDILRSGTRLRNIVAVHIVGTFSGGHPASLGRFERAPVKFLSYHRIALHHRGYATVRFTVDPARNREIEYFRTYMNNAVSDRLMRTDSDIPLALFLADSELRRVIVPMEQNLSLLQQLLPIVVILTFVVSSVLSFLLMIQDAKLAAKLRVLGITKAQTLMLLIVMKMVVCASGVAVGILFVFFLGINTNVFLVLYIWLFFLGGGVGSLAGAIAITTRQPLSLIQVNE